MVRCVSKVRSITYKKDKFNGVIGIYVYWQFIPSLTLLQLLLWRRRRESLYSAIFFKLYFGPKQLLFSFCSYFGILMDKLAKLYVNEIVRLYGVPISIVLDRYLSFTSRLQTNLQQALRTKLNLSTIFHPQTDGQFERTIQTLKDLIRYCLLELLGSPVIDRTH